MPTREFTFTEGTSDKFWKITLDAKKTTVNYGRRDTDGQTQTKEYASDDEATKSYDKLIAEKVKKGYTETGASAKGVTAPTASVAPKAPAAPKTAPAKAKKADAEDAAVAEAETPAPAAKSIAIAEPAPAPITISAERRIRLDPHDWLWAPWRKTKITLPEPAPFDLESCFARLKKLKHKQGKYNYKRLVWMWNAAEHDGRRSPLLVFGHANG